MEGHTKLEGVGQVSVLVGQAQELCVKVGATGVAQLLTAQKALLYGAQHLCYVPRHVAAFLQWGGDAHGHTDCSCGNQAPA